MYKFFIERPIVSIVIAAIMVIVGAVAVLGLPTAQFPNIADPQIQVLGTYVGADALTVEQSVATPIEQQMSGVDNMEYMYSLNANNGQTTITVDFNVKTDPSTDQILTQMRQSQAASQLPTAVNNYGVTVQKSTQTPMMLLYASMLCRGDRARRTRFAILPGSMVPICDSSLNARALLIVAARKICSSERPA